MPRLTTDEYLETAEKRIDQEMYQEAIAYTLIAIAMELRQAGSDTRLKNGRNL